MLTQENVESLNDFLETAGVLKGLDSPQAHAICVDLVWKVTLIVTEAVDKNTEEFILAPMNARRQELACS